MLNSLLAPGARGGHTTMDCGTSDGGGAPLRFDPVADADDDVEVEELDFRSVGIVGHGACPRWSLKRGADADAVVNRKARMGRNPATGATIKIAAKQVVKFRVAKAAKDTSLRRK